MKNILKNLSNLFCKLTNRKLIHVAKCHGTFKFDIANFKTKEARSFWVQFSLKNPWLIPHYEKHFSDQDIPLAGWLFLYFSITNEGLLYAGDNKSKITGPNGDKYYFYPFPNRKMADDYHSRIKAGKNFYILRVNRSNNEEKLYVKEVTKAVD